MSPHAPPQVRILGTQYLVVLDGQTHIVGKDKRCHTCPNDGTVCPAVYAVAHHLKAGGPRAPDTLPTPPSTSDTNPLPPCPICGEAVTADHVLDHLTHGPGWRCTEGGYAHLYLHRYAHLKAWFCGEGARRHAMFLPDEPPAVQLRLPEPNIVPFEKPTSTQHRQVV